MGDDGLTVMLVVVGAGSKSYEWLNEDAPAVAIESLSAAPKNLSVQPEPMLNPTRPLTFAAGLAATIALHGTKESKASGTPERTVTHA